MRPTRTRTRTSSGCLAENIGFGPTSDVRLAVLEADEGLLVIGLNAPVGHMAEAEELTQSVRDSITIHQPGR